MAHPDRTYFTAMVHSPRAVWLALVLAWFVALAPTLSHALTAARGQIPVPLLELCTRSGMRLVEATGQSQASHGAPAAAQALADCPFCLLGADRVVPAPRALHLAWLPALAQPPLRTQQAHFFLRPWVLAPPPRGPPVFS